MNRKNRYIRLPYKLRKEIDSLLWDYAYTEDSRLWASYNGDKYDEGYDAAADNIKRILQKNARSAAKYACQVVRDYLCDGFDYSTSKGAARAAYIWLFNETGCGNI